MCKLEQLEFTVTELMFSSSTTGHMCHANLVSL